VLAVKVTDGFFRRLFNVESWRTRLRGVRQEGGRRSHRHCRAFPFGTKSITIAASHEIEFMKRYLIFGALGPFFGGFLLLFATTYASGYWTQTNAGEIKKLFVVFARTLQFAYLFGIVPALMMAAIDDILFHVKRINWVARVLIVGALAFVVSQLIYGGLKTDAGAIQFILFGLPGLIPATVASWLAHKYAEPQPQPAA
jgi:hypothetical protein